LIKEDYFNLSTMLNLKRPMDISCTIASKPDIYHRQEKHEFIRTNYFLMEINMSKRVSEHFIYLCIPEFYLPAARGWGFEVAATVAWLHTQVINKA
jgi:hypothetical protein